ncbi:MAG: choice-of-anchor D domain-containing protein [Bryobacteraceae bacterium]
MIRALVLALAALPAMAQDVIVSYLNYNFGNQTILKEDDVIGFPVTAIGSRSSFAVVISNRGKNPVSIAAVDAAGPGFELSQVPLLPAAIVGGGETRFNIQFAPVTAGDSRGQLRLRVAGVVYNYGLLATGAAAVLEFESLTGSGDAVGTVPPVIDFGAAAVNISRNVVRFRIRNTGNAEGRVGNLAISGSSFSLLDPPSLPYTLQPGEAIYFGIAFVPREIGDVRGQFRLDNRQFVLAGRGTGAQLTAALAFGDIRLPLKAQTPAIVPNTDVGSRRTFGIEVSNTGDETGFLAAVSAGGDGFSVAREVRFPLAVPPGQTVRIEAVFAPVEVGTIVGSLLVHDESYKLIGVGSEPPPLPAARFSGVPTQAQSLDQPSVGLELDEPYPYDLSGKLVLSFSSESFLDDPAVQFVTGARTVDFRIPANTTTAIFGSSLRSVRMQTGSLAGTITLVAQMTAGKFDLTRGSPPVTTVEIPPGPPVIRSISLLAKNAKSFDLVIRGAAPSRSVERLEFTLTAAPGVRLATNLIRLNVSSQFDSWFRSSDSKPFGSQFTVTVSFDLSADFSAIQSIDVRAFNPLGGSAAKRVTVGTDQ